MFKLFYNLICAPEMSFENMDNVPNAYVQFEVDEEKEIVPVNFIRSFPRTWRESGWDRDYLYKVFWSPDSEDSPSKMLKRAPEIPLYERGATLTKPGYYRASVLLVKESRQSLEDAMAEKRVSAGPLKLKYTSFDYRDTMKGKEPKGQQPNTKKNSQSSTNNSKRKKKGINREAQRDNVSDLKIDLNKRFPFLMEERDEKYSGNGEDKEEECAVAVNKEVPNSQSGRDQASKVSTSHESPYPARKRKSSGYFDALSDSDDGDMIINEKKIKLDPNYTPKKCQELEDELRIMKSNLKRANDLNARLRLSLNEAEEKNVQMQKQIDSMNSGCKIEERPENTVLNSICEISLNADSAPNNFENDPKPIIESVSEGKDTPMREDKSTKPAEMDLEIKGHELIEGVVIPHKVWEVIRLIPPGKKKDKTYIKDLTIAAHGPQRLATSTIMGTKKGGRKKQEGVNTTPKPALSKQTLKAVRDLLIKRVEIEEGKIEDPDEHERTKLSTYHEAIRGAQKRVLSLGYGKSEKPNDVTVDLLMGQ